MEAVIVALVSGGITLVGVLIANSKTQAVMDTKLEELTREVREHNNFAKRCLWWRNKSRSSIIGFLT